METCSKIEQTNIMLQQHIDWLKELSARIDNVIKGQKCPLT